jgi:hypothetical protein
LDFVGRRRLESLRVVGVVAGRVLLAQGTDLGLDVGVPGRVLVKELTDGGAYVGGGSAAAVADADLEFGADLGVGAFLDVAVAGKRYERLAEDYDDALSLVLRVARPAPWANRVRVRSCRTRFAPRRVV